MSFYYLATLALGYKERKIC